MTEKSSEEQILVSEEDIKKAEKEKQVIIKNYVLNREQRMQSHLRIEYKDTLIR